MCACVVDIVARQSGDGSKSGLARPHAREQIQLGAYVGSFRLFERIFIIRRGDGAVATETYRTTSAVVVADVLKGKSSCVSEGGKRLGGHDRASIQARRNDPGATSILRAMRNRPRGSSAVLSFGAGEGSLLAGDSRQEAEVSK
jgi:hypothetical protein